ncbi:MAG: C4-dicarboxylate ABC transporter [Gammaproteobacteria bacterium]|nr:C4-dicarboxylate ABC transporter [Gammaproteobacteria bacterium]MYF61733.1 C4-dicarboxylate ABC transporter [Gammaproteobacteria bacterium]MYI23292.1 C4-dicarboxylate ABC transporter [Gammaproteobacteria bacterium]
MNEPGWISLLPTVLAIVLAIWSRQVYVSLAAGIWIGWTILEGWNPLTGLATAIEQTVAVLGDPGNAKVILFTLVIGAMIATLEAAGGVRGFVRWIEGNRWVTDGRRAQFLAWIIGIVIFIESNITVLVAGAVSRPLFDRFRISRERLAYIVDSTSAPICILIPLNAWGALNLGILNELGVEDALGVFIAAIPVNFYALIAFLLAGASIVWKIDLGPMKRAEKRAAEGQVLWPNAQPMVDETVLSPTPVGRIAPRARNMLVPIAVMVLTMPLGLYVTGGGSMLDGSGSTSVLWAVLAGLGAAWLLLLGQRGATLDELTRTGLKGAGGLMPLALILLLALALGSVARTLGAGEYVAQVTEGVLAPMLFLPLVFVVAGGIAFSIGSSWGTFAIMLPIAVPVAETLGMPLAPFVAAALSGGIFGDHSSPISDTTIISSMAAATDHIDHVRTQLPYALLAGGAAAVCFAVLGATL